MQPLDVAHLRGVLAMRRISHRDFAAACGLTPQYLSRLLCGRKPGELARLKIARGLHALGLDCEALHAG
jgi:transcriptional regulator with XRE-family HTH domain